MSDRSTPRAWVTWALLGAVAVLAVFPLVIGAGEGMEEPFAGADGQAEGLVEELNPDYEPWLAPLVELPSGEVESGLFALQAAIGAGVIGYVLGVARTRSRHREQAPEAAATPAAGSAGSTVGSAGSVTGPETASAAGPAAADPGAPAAGAAGSTAGPATADPDTSGGP